MSKWSEGCLISIAGVALSVPLFIYEGWVATLLWGWFVVPTFGAAPIPIAVALGLGSLVWLVAPKSGTLADQEAGVSALARSVNAFIVTTVGITTVLVVGWICAGITGVR